MVKQKASKQLPLLFPEIPYVKSGSTGIPQSPDNTKGPVLGVSMLATGLSYRIDVLQ